MRAKLPPLGPVARQSTPVTPLPEVQHESAFYHIVPQADSQASGGSSSSGRWDTQAAQPCVGPSLSFVSEGATRMDTQDSLPGMIVEEDKPTLFNDSFVESDEGTAHHQTHRVTGSLGIQVQAHPSQKDPQNTSQRIVDAHSNDTNSQIVSSCPDDETHLNSSITSLSLSSESHTARIVHSPMMQECTSSQNAAHFLSQHYDSGLVGSQDETMAQKHTTNSTERALVIRKTPTTPTTSHDEKSHVGKQATQTKRSPSLWQRFVVHPRKAKRELGHVQGVWEQMDTGSVESAVMPGEMIISGSTRTSADGATKSLILKNGCIHMEDMTLTLDQDGSLYCTRISGCSARYRKAILAAGDMVINLQGEWQPSGMQTCNMDSPRLVIQGLTWRLASPSASTRTQGFVLNDTVDNTPLICGCKVAIGPDGTLSMTMHNRHNLIFVRHMEATAAVFTQRLGYTGLCIRSA